jgi:uncharacterized membrane protein
MTSEPSQEIADLQVSVKVLAERVNRLERALPDISVENLRGTGAMPAPRTPRPTSAPAASIYGPPNLPSRPEVPRPATPSPPSPPTPPFNWGKLADQLFAARTLAWAGGVATVVGIVLLFVMAASRGWITPTMRVGIGVLVSLGLVAAALEFDRRGWRSDAILAAAGAGIAGLYASLWAATSVYHLVSPGASAPLAAVIAGTAVAVALRVKQEPLALFGMSAAMLAPLAVSQHVTTGGVMFGAVMVAASLPLLVRTGWRSLVTSVWAIGVGETFALLRISWPDVGLDGPVIAAAAMAALIACLTFLLELRPGERRRLTALGSLTAASAFALTLGGTFLYGGFREVDGHSLSGFALGALTVVWFLAAAVPVAVRRPHADLTDLLAAFGLTSAAIATGLLAGGPALVCAWTAESAMLVLVGERIQRRSATRNVRAIVSAAAYLLLGIVATIQVIEPLPETLPRIGSGSVDGSIALVALALAGTVLCFGLRRFVEPALAGAWIVPALALGFLPIWALPAESAVITYAGMAALLLLSRRTHLLARWMPEWVGLVMASAWWMAGAIVALAVTAPVDDLVHGWAQLGQRHGLAGLAALLAAAVVFAWSVRRPVRTLCEYGLLVPVATLGYVIAALLPTPYAIWAWLVVAGILAAAVQVAPIRRSLTVNALLVASASALTVGVVAAWARDDSLLAIVDHAATTGWESIALATGAAFLLALALREPLARTNALWLPFLLAAQLCAMLLPGQYPLVGVAALSALAGVVALVWPSTLASRLERHGLRTLAVISAAANAGLVLFAYETPNMLLRTSNTPAAGLAAATAATVALLVAAAATRCVPCSIGSVPAATLLVYSGGAACLWTLAAAILGAEQLVADAGLQASVHDHFQQGHVLVSISWVVIGLALVMLSLRGDHRALRVGGISLLFLAVGKLFLYDLAFLTAMARAISFIVSGSVLLLAALLLQRFAPQVKAALGDDSPEPSSRHSPVGW